MTRRFPILVRRGLLPLVVVAGLVAILRVRSGEELSPLRQAAGRGDADRVAELVERGADVQALSAGSLWDFEFIGAPPLHMTCSDIGADAARVLLRAGARVDARDTDGFTALDRAAQGGAAEVVRVLLEWGAVPDARTFELARSGRVELELPMKERE